MWVFLGSEVLFFGGLMMAYAVYRLAFPETFGEASSHLDKTLGGINTAVLLTSSLFMALADRSAEAGDRAGMVRRLALTAGLGIVFLVIKGYEWAKEARENLVPIRELRFEFPGEADRHGEMFYNLYFAMTGVHALHLLIGVALVLYVILRTRRGTESEPQVRATGLYWHFVDVVWVFLYPILYLVG
jgi:cytochrome c oxidase subunit 3